MLDTTQVIDATLTLKYHSTRIPSQHTIRKIQEARKTAIVALSDAIECLISCEDPMDFGRALVLKSLEWHFALKIKDNKHDRVITRLRLIKDGLTRPVKFADVLGKTSWDPHQLVVTSKNTRSGVQEIFAKDSEVEKDMAGIHRAMPATMQKVMGFVKPRKQWNSATLKKEEKGYEPGKSYDETNQGSIHLHFAICESMSTYAITYLIIHEASHKFVGTLDAAYAEGLVGDYRYEELGWHQKVINADSYAYFCMCMLLRTFIKGKRDLFTMTKPEPPLF